MIRKSLVTCVLWLMATVGAWAQSPDPLLGTWALQVEGRNLFVLHLEAAQSGATGSMQWPHSNMGFSSTGIRLSQVTLPLTIGKVKELRSTPSGRVFSAVAGDSSSPEFALRPDGHGGLLFRAVGPGFESVPVRMTRVADSATVATDWDPAGTWLIRTPAAAPNAELAALFQADQADRGKGVDVDWKVVAPRDAARRARVRQMLDAGELRAGEDYYNAAFIFQHGDAPSDYLLAHVLANAALALGADAAWISSATLDRYLHNIGQMPVFGGGFTPQPDGSLKLDEFDAALIPDSVRRIFGVPTRDGLEAQRQQLEKTRARP
jgi:hypothetical protein